MRGLHVRMVVLLEEVVGRSSRDVRLASPRRRVELQERVLQMLVNLHDGGLIAAAVALHTNKTTTRHNERTEKKAA